MHDGVAGAGNGLVGPLDQLGATLHQHLDRHVVGDAVLFDDLADEVEVRLRGGRKTDLDLLEPHPHQRLEELSLRAGSMGSINA